MTSIGYSTWLEINLRVIQENISKLKAITGTGIMPVIKANAYGHGDLATAQAAVNAGVEWFGLARIEEAIALRNRRIEANLLVLGYTPHEQVRIAAEEEIRVAIYDFQILDQYKDRLRGCDKKLKVHIKLETGMGRLGIPQEFAIRFIKQIQSEPFFEIEGIFTHLARADEPDQPLTTHQIDSFMQIVKVLRNEGIQPKLLHTSNTAGAIYAKEGRFDLVRPGVGIYGLDPSPDAPLPEGFEPALQWKARLVSVKEFAAGCGIGYGSAYITSKNERIGVVPVGYADGYRRTKGNYMIVRGKRVPVIGRVCMDQSIIQLDDVPDAQVGDIVTVIGRDGDASIWMEEIAAIWGTINYEVATGLAARLPRIYLEN